MNTLRQIDDVKDHSEFEIQIDNAFGEVMEIETQMKRCRAAIANKDPFALMVELAQAQKLIRNTMHFAIHAQDEHIKPIKEEQQRIG